jgi:hypothetical protein
MRSAWGSYIFGQRLIPTTRHKCGFIEKRKWNDLLRHLPHRDRHPKSDWGVMADESLLTSVTFSRPREPAGYFALSPSLSWAWYDKPNWRTRFFATWFLGWKWTDRG